MPRRDANHRPIGGRHALQSHAPARGGSRAGSALGPRAAHDHRQRRESDLGRRGQAALPPAGKGHGLDRRHLEPRGAADPREPSPDELGLRPADEPPDHPRWQARARRQLDGLGAGRRRLEARARHQALRHRPHGKPAGKRALAVKFPGHKVAMLEINGQKVTYTKYDMPAGLWPYNIDITPNGKIALTADNGNAGASDGHVDTVSVIDLESTPPRVIDRVVVGDAPEGFAISPTGEIAVAILLNGSAGVPKNAWFANRAGKVVVLKIDGKKVTKIGEVEVGGLPEGVVFSPDGKYLYVGNYTDRDVSILQVDGTPVTDTGKRFNLPGQPASMRGAVR